MDSTNLVLDFQDSYCDTSEFWINGIEADLCDFGNKITKPIKEGGYGCDCLIFEYIQPSVETLVKYSITNEEHWNIYVELREGLERSKCTMCE